MGCAPSNLNRNDNFFSVPIIRRTAAGIGMRGADRSLPSSEPDFSPKYDITLRQILRVTPPIEISIGSGVLPANDASQIVIFVFGGPGSLKGILTQELAEEFEFITINAEDIIFSYLPLKVANTVSDVVQMQELIRRDANVINLKWIFQMISTKLSTSNGQRFVIDIVPELISLLRSNAYANADDQENCLKEFEIKHNVLFALDLCIAEDRLIMESKSSGSESSSKNSRSLPSLSTLPSSITADGRPALSAEMSAFLRGVDEADKGRLEKRIAMYRKCSEPFLNYFRKAKRVVRMDLRVPNNDELVPTIRHVLTDFGFGRNNDSIRVVLFVLDKEDLEEIDLEYYRLRRISLLDICHDENETMAILYHDIIKLFYDRFGQQIRAIRKFIYRTAKPNENIAVDLCGLNNTTFEPNKRINFLEYHTTYLDFYIRSRENRSPRSRCRMSFRSITSTSGEACLFPESMPSQMCLKIGYAFGEKLSYSETDTRAPSQLSGETGAGFTGGLPVPSFVGS